MAGPVVHGINGFGQVFALAASYYVGTEIISLAAGETKDPRKSVPRVGLTLPSVSLSLFFRLI
jgi:amino acid permease